MNEQTALYRKNTSTGERLAVPTGRPADFYLSLLGIVREELKGKNILNLGAGGSDLQADLVDEEASVTNLDLSYTNRGRMAETMMSALAPGSMTQLPEQFAANSFDIVIALYSAGHPPRSLDSATLIGAVHCASEVVKIYPCAVSRATRQFIINQGLESIVTIDTPTFDPKLLFANAPGARFLQKLQEPAKNAYYLTVEAIAKLFRSQRISIDTAALKKREDWQDICAQLTAKGLKLSSI